MAWSVLPLLLLSLLTASTNAAPPTVSPYTPSPIVGVLTVPSSSASSCISYSEASSASGHRADYYPPSPPGLPSCFANLYVKWLEAAGLRVAPIPYDLPEAEQRALFDGVNALLFTGGDLSLFANTTYYQAAQRLYGWALAENGFAMGPDGAAPTGVPAASYFPVWGTCMGFQLLCLLGSGGDYAVITHGVFDAHALSLPLEPLEPAFGASRLFGGGGGGDGGDGGDGGGGGGAVPVPAAVVGYLTSENVTTNLHSDGVTPATYAANAASFASNSAAAAEGNLSE